MLALILLSSLDAMAGLMSNFSATFYNATSFDSCKDVEDSDLEVLQKSFNDPTCAHRKYTVGEMKQSSNAIAEAALFQDLAKANFEEASCAIENANVVSGNQKLQEAIAGEIHKTLPLITENLKEADKYYREYQQIMGKNNSISALCRSQKGEEAIKCQEGLKPAKIDEKSLYDKWIEHTANAEKMILSLWNGNSKIMKELILELAKKEPPPTQKEIKDRFSYTLPWVSHGLKETKSSLLNQSEERSKNVSRSEGYQTERVFKDDLTDKAKTELLQLAISNGYFDKDFGEAEKPMFKLLCQVEARFTKGPDRVSAAFDLATFAFGGAYVAAAKYANKVRLLRLASARSASTVKNFLAKNSKLKNASDQLVRAIKAAPIAVEYTAFLTAFTTNCLQKGIKFEPQNICPFWSEDIQKAEKNRIELNDCILQSALLAAGATGLTHAALSASAGPKTAKNLPPTRSTQVDSAQASVSKMDETSETARSVAQPIPSAVKDNNAETAVAKTAENLPGKRMDPSREQRRQEVKERLNTAKQTVVNQQPPKNLTPSEQHALNARMRGERTGLVLQQDVKRLKDIGFAESDIAEIDAKKAWKLVDWNKLIFRRLGPEGRKQKGELVDIEIPNSNEKPFKVVAYIKERYLGENYMPTYKVFYKDPVTGKTVEGNFPVTKAIAEKLADTESKNPDKFLEFLASKAGENSEIKNSVLAEKFTQKAIYEKRAAEQAARSSSANNTSRIEPTEPPVHPGGQNQDSLTIDYNNYIPYGMTDDDLAKPVLPVGGIASQAPKETPRAPTNTARASDSPYRQYERGIQGGTRTSGKMPHFPEGSTIELTLDNGTGRILRRTATINGVTRKGNSYQYEILHFNEYDQSVEVLTYTAEELARMRAVMKQGQRNTPAPKPTTNRPSTFDL